MILLGWLLFLFVRQFACQDRQGIWGLAIILGGNVAAIVLFRGDLVYAVTDHAARYLPFIFFFVPVLFALGCHKCNRPLKWVNYGLIFLILMSMKECQHQWNL